MRTISKEFLGSSALERAREKMENKEIDSVSNLGASDSLSSLPTGTCAAWQLSITPHAWPEADSFGKIKPKASRLRDRGTEEGTEGWG